MAEVEFFTTVGGDGSVVSDDSNPATGLADGGHRTRFVPALAQVVAVAQFVVQKAADAAAAAASALGGVGSIATSSSTLTIGAADHSLNVGAGKTFAAGQKLGIARTSAATTTAMYGTVLNYSGSTLQVRIAAGDFIGSGTHSDWTVSPTLYGPPASRAISAAGLATGGGDLGADRTITVPAAVKADIQAGTSATKAATPEAITKSAEFQVLSYGATVNWDLATGYNAYLTLGGNPILAAPTNPKDGLTYTLYLDQGAVGNRTIGTYNAIFEFGATGQPVLSTGVNKVDMVFFQYSAATTKLHMIGFRKAA